MKLVAVLLAVVGAALVAVSVEANWAHAIIYPPAPLPKRTVGVPGRVLLSGGRTLAVVAVTAAVAALAAPRWARRPVGAVILGCGLGIGWQAVHASSSVEINAQLGQPVGVISVGRSLWPVVVAVAGGLAVTAAGLLVVIRGPRWDGLSSSYQAPAAREPETQTDKGVWESLDRGEDPTA